MNKNYMKFTLVGVVGWMASLSATWAAPDLYVAELSAPSEIVIGESFSATVTVGNQGTDVTTENSVFFSVFLSADQILDANDVCAGYGSMVSLLLEAGMSAAKDVQLLVNAANVTAGTYYLIAVADDLCGTSRIAESDESNNTLAAGLVSVFDSDAQVDLSITDLIGPVQAARGKYLRLDTYLTNLGPDAAPGRSASTCGYYTGFYLSTDPTITTDDIDIGRVCLNSLAGETTNRFWMDVLVPADLPRGFYYWGAIADPTEILAETNEGNNAFSGIRVRIH